MVASRGVLLAGRIGGLFKVGCQDFLLFHKKVIVLLMGLNAYRFQVVIKDHGLGGSAFHLIPYQTHWSG